MDDVAELMQKTLFKDFDKPVKPFRYSKKEEGKIRPLKLSDEQAQWNFLKRANHNLRSDGMFCKLDVNDTLLYPEVNSNQEKQLFQLNINALHDWSTKWKMPKGTRMY